MPTRGLETVVEPGVLSHVRIPTDGVVLEGDLTTVPHAMGVVLFAHGSGSSRHSPRNRFVAGTLQQAGLSTLLFDLLTSEEAEERGNVFDVTLLADRLLAAVHWAFRDPRTAEVPMGLFGASTGAAAALVAAAREPGVRAVVSRGGRPDLAEGWLPFVHAPTLLIVGGRDAEVLRLNRLALPELAGPRQLAEVPGASHLFEEAGALEWAARLATSWFVRQLPEEPTP